MEKIGQKPDLTVSSKAHYEAQVNDGLLDLEYLIWRVEGKELTLNLEDWQNSMNAQVANICSSLKMLRLITKLQSFQSQGLILGTM